MLKSWEAARNVNGPSQSAIAKAANCSTQAVYSWQCGINRCPVKKRASVERAMGTQLDWFEYDQEVDALKTPPEAPSTVSDPTPAQTPPETPTPPAQRVVDEFADFYGVN